jgi:hypothetical protein
MGIFSFLKKKESDLSTQKPFDLEGLNTDLPNIDGSKIDELKLPSLDAPLELPKGQQDTSFDMPQLDPAFSAQEDVHTGGYHDSSFHGLPDDISNDMNQLFLSDPEWKEPNWENYEPYYEEQIEPPTMHDFGIDPPQPIGNPEISLPEQQYDIPEFTDIEPKEHAVPDDVPYDVFVKGTDYDTVFSEIDNVKKILNLQDEKINQVLNTFKIEESTIASCKDNMELLYKKMLLIDKKVFA